MSSYVDIPLGHEAVLIIVNALNHGKTIEDIVTAFCCAKLSEKAENELSEALMNLADEICSSKQVEIVTASSQCNVFEKRPLLDSLKLFITAVENSCTSITEIFALLHPSVLDDDNSSNAIKSLPTCCSGDRILMVS